MAKKRRTIRKLAPTSAESIEFAKEPHDSFDILESDLGLEPVLNSTVRSPISNNWAEEVGKEFQANLSEIWSQFKANEVPNPCTRLSFAEPIKVGDQLVAKLDLDEVEIEASYWKNVIVCIVLGVNPPFKVFEGFVKRVWGNMGIEKVVRMNSGFTLVKFRDEVTRDLVREVSVIHFDKKTSCASSLVCRNGFSSNDKLSSSMDSDKWSWSPILGKEKPRCSLADYNKEKLKVWKKKQPGVCKEDKKEAPNMESVTGDEMKSINGCETAAEEEKAKLASQADMEKTGSGVEILDEDTQLVHCRVKFSGKKVSFLTTVVYGSNSMDERTNLWQKLEGYGLIHEPWIIFGDFNAMSSFQDRNGGRPVQAKDILDAQTWLANGQVQEFKCSGASYTWNNKHAVG
uniref:DUF4283 domain-containing protein n=1 Tax=Cannabis sativa TaxID=3483 RepID=A0A803PYL3_CANSA